MTNVVDWNDYPPLPADAEAQVEAWIETERRFYDEREGGTILASDALVSPIAARRPFAIFGDSAYQISEFENCADGLNHAYRPALTGCTAYFNAPPEGRAGVLYWLYSSLAVARGLRPWSIITIGTPWLYTRELLLPPEEIRQGIIAEAEHKAAVAAAVVEQSAHKTALDQAVVDHMRSAKDKLKGRIDDD